MAPKTLSTFLSPLPLPHNLRSLNPKFLKIRTNLSPILSQTTQPPPQSRYRTPTLESVARAEGLGTGAAAPTRGDLFLERQQSVAAAKIVVNEEKRNRKKKKERERVLKVNAAIDSCYGCGAPLQTLESDAPGYVEQDTFDLKKKHHQLRNVLCGRCQLLSHGHMITAVGGNGGYSGGKQFVSSEQLREKLSHLRHTKALIVKLVDVVDFSGSLLTRVRDLVGANPIILVVTKVDLLPKGTDFNCIGDWVVEAITKKKLNVMSVHLTSSKSLVGITGVASEIQKEKKGRDVYILGSANVGKSAFINALLKLMSQKDPVAAAARRYKPIQSAVPGTTLGPIQIDAFFGGGKLYDTPGVHLHHRQAAVVHSEDLPALAPRSRLRGQTFPVTSDNNAAEKFESNGLNGFSIFWGGLVRIDVLKVLPETRLTFYGPKALGIHVVPSHNADEFYQKEIGHLLTPPTGKLQADNQTALKTERQLLIKFDDPERPACDIAISGLGWIAVEPISKSQKTSDSDFQSDFNERRKELIFAVHVPKPVEIFVRPPLPVGKAGSEWYKYPELTEDEIELRPKWFF